MGSHLRSVRIAISRSVGRKRPTAGSQIFSDALAVSLRAKLEAFELATAEVKFSAAELAGFHVRELTAESFIQVDDEYFVVGPSLEGFCAFLEAGAKVGLSGCMRMDIAATAAVRVELVLRPATPLSLSFRSAVARALLEVLDLDSARLSDVVVPADAHKLVTARAYTKEGFSLVALLPAPTEELAEQMKERLIGRISSARLANEQLSAALHQPNGLTLAVAHNPAITMVAERGQVYKVPTPRRSLEKALEGREQLEQTRQEDLLERNFVLLPCFGTAAEASHLDLYVGLGLLKSVVSLRGLHLDEIQLADSCLRLDWQQPTERERAFGRVGALVIDATLAFEHATLKAKVGFRSPSGCFATCTLDIARSLDIAPRCFKMSPSDSPL